MNKYKNFTIVCVFLFAVLSIAQTNNGPVKSNKESGLMFNSKVEERLDDSSYTDIIQLLGLSEKLQALQFKILVNKSKDDSTIIKFKDIQKGDDINDPGWLLTQKLNKGAATPNGASKDEIYVLLYNSNLNDGLKPGNYSELFKVIYEIVDAPHSKSKIKSSLKISQIQASSPGGSSVNIKSNHNELKIFVK